MKCCVKKLLCILHSIQPAARKQLLLSADKELVIAICECALNILKGNVPLTTDEKKNLSSHKNTLRQLSNKGVALKKKKAILIQKGGGAFLPLLLAPIVTKLLNYIV